MVTGVNPRRPLIWCTSLAVLATGLILPVAQWPTAERSAVTPTEQSITLTGVDPGAVSDSAIAMASWSGDGLVQALPLASPARVTTAAVSTVAPLRPALATRTIDTQDFGLVAVTADSPLDERTRVLVRVRESGQWSSWEQLEPTDDRPDPGSAEAAAARYGTAPLLTGTADGVQVRMDTPDGIKPANAQVVLFDNPVVKQDADLPDSMADTGPIATVEAATLGAPRPTIISRAEWGADESLRRGAPSYAGTIKAAFLHHTVTTNDYTPEQAAQQVRNLYSYFVKGLKYSDMAYNFIVDRFGRLYEGRAGGMDQAVVGGHTAGFNQDTFAVSALGNFQTAALAPEQMNAIDDAVASLFAWKLGLNHRDPNGTTPLISDSSAGTSKYKAGQIATAMVIGGHRDIGSTACPGKYLEPQLPAIRAATTAKLGVTAVNPAVSAPVPWGAGQQLVVSATTNAPLTWTMSIASRCGTVVRNLSGTQAAAGALSIGWDGLDSTGAQVPPGAYTFVLNGTSGADAIYPWTGTGVISATANSPIDPCGPPDSFSLTGSGYGHGVGLSQWGAYGMAKEGFDASSIVAHYYPNTSVAPVQDDMDIRVNLFYRVATARMRAEALDAGGGAIEVTVGATVVAGGPNDVFTFNVAGGAVNVQRTVNGQTSSIGTAPSATVKWAGTRDAGSAVGPTTAANVIGPNGSFTTPGHRYRYGKMEVIATSSPNGPRLNVVNQLRLHDEYLYGISEVSSSWPDAAMQAQVIAARSYAMAKIAAGVRKACDCHLDDGNGPFGDQFFVGWAKASSAKGDRWLAAVNATLGSETTGIAALYNGQPISAFYSASTGGITNSSKDVWGGDLPYSTNVDDHWSLSPDNPNASWTVNVPQAAMAAAFGVPAVWKVAVAERLASGAVRTLSGTMQDGSQRTISGDTMRSKLGLKSSYINAVNGQAVPGAPTITPGATPAPAPTTAQLPAAAATITMAIGPTSKPKAGTSLKFKGRVVPAVAGLVVQRQMKVDGVWQLKASTTTKPNGHYRFTIKKAVPAGAQYEYRVVALQNGAEIASSASGIINIRK
ncbi:MAG: SpoIID/LytB domain-containing protein [Actinomycetota bacterium]|nr:SpoIID/LytB domain-containing protein [Actinomycetota bacterium]